MDLKRRIHDETNEDYNLSRSDHPRHNADGIENDDISIALKVENLSKVFDSPAGRLVVLRKINFIIRKGEFVSIVGPSGSGKSTLLNIVGGLDKPSYGRIVINGIDIFSLKVITDNTRQRSNQEMNDLI